MTVLLFGATGMIGHGALTAALHDDRVTRVVTVGRRATGREHPKLDEIVHTDLSDLGPLADRLAQADACLFCLGVSSAGMSEADYRDVTYDLTLSVARQLAERNPAMTYVYVSGQGTDRGGRQMWARVKGETEDALLALPFRAAYNARPGFIQPVGGAVSRTALYRALYAAMTPLMPVFRRVFARHYLDTDQLGRALVEAGVVGAPQATLDVPDLQALAARAERHATA
ncbi:NAD-dependent epimerase/dehydratase family protein [Rubrivirga sp. IMCC45206]|uniref:NAD-dependent epimerase/dehydratase family protein n=1 Tax=Rubrivirga sp. IMCC45206 TaxID=3391614 RepID=UPI00399006E4